MRIVALTTWFPDAVAPSTAPFNLNHVQAVAAEHEVHVIHVRLGGRGAVVREEFGGVAVTRLPLSPKKPWSYLAVARTLAGALNQADVLHTMAFTSAAVAAPVMAFRKKPWVHTEHWSGMADPASVSKLWAAFSLLRYVLKLPGAVTAVSTAQAADLARFARPGAMHVVPNVVDVQATLAARRGPDDGVVRLVGVGGLIERKRPGLALEALRLLRESGINASLTWVGDGPLRAELEAASHPAGLADAFTITGMVAPERVTEELRKADVFILPTRHETFCVSAAEAVAAGLPAVVSELPAVRDFLTARNSVLVHGDSATDFADGVREAIQRFSTVSSADIAATIGASLGRAAIGAKFSSIYAGVTARSKHGS